MARESKTLATITFQNYFRLYNKLSGMTGTAMTEEEEFSAIYKLDIVEIPTNKPVIRMDHPDVVYKTRGRQVPRHRRPDRGVPREGPAGAGGHHLHRKVGAALQACSSTQGIKHNVLNAKNHEKEAEIVAQAGKLGAVTVATNMAGRGTDIMLGGNAEFLAKADLRKAGYHDELIAEATGYCRDRRRGDPRCPQDALPRPEAKYKEEIDAEADKVRAGGRPVHPRHRAPRVPPHRQPAARPCRPSGRPRREPLLPVPGGRHHAPVRLRAGAWA